MGSHVNNFGNNEYKAFLGALPPHLTSKDILAVVKHYPGYVDFFYPTTGKKGWCTVEFSSRKKRDEFVRNKHRYNAEWNQIIDIKEYVWVPKQERDKNNAAAAAASPSKAAPSAKARANVSGAPRAPWAAASAPQPARTPNSVVVPSAAPDQDLVGVVLRYFPGGRDHLGLIRTADGSNGQLDTLFHVDVVYYCCRHKLWCSGGAHACASYGRLSKPLPGDVSLSQLLPVNTRVHFRRRSLDEMALVPFPFQATAVWATMSGRPIKPGGLASDVFDVQLIDYVSQADSPSPSPARRPSPLPPPQQHRPQLQQQPVQQPRQPHQHFVHAPLPTFSSMRNFDPPPDNRDINSNPAAVSRSAGGGASDAGSRGSGRPVAPTGSSQHPTTSDIDNYMDILKQLRDFLEGQLRTAGVEDCPNLLQLARKIMKTMDGGNASNGKQSHVASAAGALTINNFLSNNGISLEKGKLQQLLAHYKVYHETLSYNVRAGIADLKAVNAMSLSAVAAKLGLQLQHPVGDDANSLEGGSSLSSHEKATVFKLKDRVNQQQQKQSGKSGALLPPGSNISGGVLSRSVVQGGGETFGKTLHHLGAIDKQGPGAIGTLAPRDDEVSSSLSSGSANAAIADGWSLFSATLESVSLKAVKSFVARGLDVQTFSRARSISVEYSAEAKKRALTLTPLETWIMKNEYDFCNVEFGTVAVDKSAQLADLAHAAVHTWLHNEKTMKYLLDIFSELGDKPLRILSHWNGMALRSWSNLYIPEHSVDFQAVVKCTFLYCFEQKYPRMARKPKTLGLLASLVMSAPYKNTQGGLCNFRGVVVHLFNEYFGVALTPSGPVLFEKHCVYSRSHHKSTGGGGDPSWVTSKKVCLGSFVKLHAVLAKAKTKRNRLGYYFATKVWCGADDASSEPFCGPEVPGGKRYWYETVQEFETVVRANPQLGVFGRDDDEKENRQGSPGGGEAGGERDWPRLYQTAVSHFLQRKLDARSNSSVFKEPEDDANEQVFSGFGEAFFKRHCSGSGKTEKRDLVSSLKVLHRSGLTPSTLLARLRLSRSLFGGDEVFLEAVERSLLSAPPAHFSRKTKRAVNVGPMLAQHLGEGAGIGAKEDFFSPEFVYELFPWAKSDGETAMEDGVAGERRIEVEEAINHVALEEERIEHENQSYEDLQGAKSISPALLPPEVEELLEQGEDTNGGVKEDLPVPAPLDLEGIVRGLEEVSGRMALLTGRCDDMGGRMRDLEGDAESVLREEFEMLRVMSQEVQEAVRAKQERRAAAANRGENLINIVVYSVLRVFSFFALSVAGPAPKPWPETKTIVRVCTASAPGEEMVTYEIPTRNDGQLSIQVNSCNLQ